MNTPGRQGAGEKETVSSRLHALLRSNHVTPHLLAKKLPDGPDRITISRILNEPHHHPRISSLEKLEDHFGCPGHLTDLYDFPDSHQQNFRPDRFLTGAWFQHIPKQAERDYESIDLVRIEKARNGEFRSEMLRVLSTRSPKDVDESWKALGMPREDRFLYLVFYSVSQNRPDSNGVIALRRDQSYRRLTGRYFKFGGDERNNGSVPRSFRIIWYREPSEVEKSSWSSEEIFQAGAQ